ncbi:hypothetical protein [Flavobacterium sp. ZE23DGlu08]|jgi:hypothetical protein|uniref:hypothetical protein n=1 Tax=Flavobacterium sp. ZE23DGlu08 TaxID=3059026 RepID=UPI00265E9E22|nr:hypothetical protein [Flavobacterium sp. ZE23DGlu08]WKL43630.1 hypothetical protein Q1W72_14930 [Flavobacterium sp. ZE23DGlu08]
MQLLTKKYNFLQENAILGLLFSFSIIEVLAELFSFKVILFAFRPLVAILLIYLYWVTSKERNVLFYMTVFFLLLTSIFILFESILFLILGLIGIFTHRILLIFYIIKLNKIKDFVPILIAIIPFVFIFSYLLSISDEIPKGSYYPLVAQNILVSILAGVILSNYFMNDSNNSPWLAIFGLLSTALYFTVFIEKCFLSNLPPTYFRPLAMILYVTSYYSFYRFVIDAETINAKKESITVIQ